MSSSDSERPNIVVIVTDQQNAKMMSCAGNQYIETPAMDQLAISGIRFDRAYCSNPVCSPSRFSILTGRYPSVIEQRSNDDSDIAPIPKNILTEGIGHRLGDCGYETVYGGKEHLPGELSVESLGFDKLTDDSRDGLATVSAEYIQQASDQPFFLMASFINPHDICYLGIRDYQQSVPETAMWRDMEADWRQTALDRLDSALKRPPTVDENSFYEDYCPPLPPNHDPQSQEPEAIQRILDTHPSQRYTRSEWSENRWREHRWAYARLTEAVDSQIGHIVSALEETGLMDNTLVIFLSDHGDMDGAHRLERKNFFYEESVRVPLIINPPGDQESKSKIEHNLVSLLDLVPTIADYGGTRPPTPCDGRSLRPLIENRNENWRSTVRVEGRFGDLLVSDRFKYARYLDGANQEQLYDLREDPGEMENAAGDHPEITAEMRETLNNTSKLY